MCEPLLFDKCEQILNKVEEAYDQYEQHFNDFDRIKFIIKKASFFKKYGFFVDSIDILKASQI